MTDQYEFVLPSRETVLRLVPEHSRRLDGEATKGANMHKQTTWTETKKAEILVESCVAERGTGGEMRRTVVVHIGDHATLTLTPDDANNIANMLSAAAKRCMADPDPDV